MSELAMYVVQIRYYLRHSHTQAVLACFEAYDAGVISRTAFSKITLWISKQK